ncbi:MAG: carbon storage regulator [Bdellovibrionaceae bacterium]|nr:carbon storage regulator [Pseudobdellovibrionaceae bacterium]
MLKLKKGKLILTRRQGEGLSIGNNIIIEVLQIKGKQVRLGIQASKDVSIIRSELMEGDMLDNGISSEKENTK